MYVCMCTSIYIYIYIFMYVCLYMYYIPGVLVHIICSLIYYMYSANTLCTVCVAHTQKR